MVAVRCVDDLIFLILFSTIFSRRRRRRRLLERVRANTTCEQLTSKFGFCDNHLLLLRQFSFGLFAVRFSSGSSELFLSSCSLSRTKTKSH